MNFLTLTLPTPFLVGPVNAYLILDDPITLIDTGPHTYDTKLALIEQLGKIGLKLNDIKQILITHAHPDHFGLAADLQLITGAAIYMHEKEIAKATNSLKYLQQMTDYLAYAGLPDSLCNYQLEHTKLDWQYVQSPKEIVKINDGHIFQFPGYELKTIFTPGHAAGHLCFLHEPEGILFAGDNLLEKITPKPVLEPIPDQPLQREKGLLQFIDSLKLLKQLNLQEILPGHGNEIVDIKTILRRLNIYDRRRKKEVINVASQLKYFNPFELTMEVFHSFRRPLDGTMAMSEILGYLDLLEAEGRIVQEQRSDKLYYSWL